MAGSLPPFHSRHGDDAQHQRLPNIHTRALSLSLSHTHSSALYSLIFADVRNFDDAHSSKALLLIMARCLAIMGTLTSPSLGKVQRTCR